MSKAFFPLFVDISGRHFLVYGGGKIASRRIGILVDFGAKITVIAPEILPETAKLPITHIAQPFVPDAMPQADFVLAATNNKAVNSQIVALCRSRGIPVNNGANQTECDFHFPAIARKGSLVAGINAAGTDHSLVKTVAQKIRNLLEVLP
ncbi:MAG: bifunctional precorrin-2 dehydrogenase/sirohydrochlorin ferrochelatase [Eubacteriales bacterium]